MKRWPAIVVWLLGSMAATAAEPANGIPDECAKVACAYIEALRSGRAEVASTISVETGAARREDIAGQWKLLRGVLAETGSLSVEEVRSDGELGAVLVRVEHPDLPTEVAIIGVALVRRGDAWQAAPLPGIFANVGLPHEPGLRQRAAAMEAWLAERQVGRLDELKQLAVSEFEQAMERSVGRAILLESSAAEIMERFLAAAEKRDLPALMALCGGLQTPRPADWDEQFASLARCLRNVDRPGKAGAWSLLTHREVVRVVFVEKETPPYFGIGFYDPHHHQRGGMITELFFQLEKSEDGLWRVDLPEELKTSAAVVEGEDGGAGMWIGRGEGEEMPDWFAAAFERLNEPLVFNDPESLGAAMVGAMEDDRFSEVLRMVARGGAEASLRRPEYHALGQTWRDLRPLGEATVIQLAGVSVDGPVAAITLRGFSAARTDELALREVIALKTGAGWALISAAAVAHVGPPATEGLKRLADSQAERLRVQTQQGREALLAAACPLAAMAPEGVDEAAALATVRAWRDAAAAGNLGVMLSQSAWLTGDGEPLAVLRRLGSETVGFSGAALRSDLLAAHREGPWTVVSARVERAGETTFPGIVVVATAAGPRVLLTVDLMFPGTRMCEFVNQTQWVRLAKLLPGEQLASLRRGFDRHAEQALAVGATRIDQP